VITPLKSEGRRDKELYKKEGVVQKRRDAV
jgi:hypothetical protein